MNIEDFKKQADLKAKNDKEITEAESKRKEKIDEYLKNIKSDFQTYFIHNEIIDVKIEEIKDLTSKSFIARACYNNSTISLTYNYSDTPLMGCVLKFFLKVGDGKQYDILVQSKKDDSWYFIYKDENIASNKFNNIYDLLADFFK